MENIEIVTIRKGEMTIMEPKEILNLEFTIPSRGIIGLRNYLLTTSGEATISHRFKEFQPFKGEIPGRLNGSLISMEQGINSIFIK